MKSLHMLSSMSARIEDLQEDREVEMLYQWPEGSIVHFMLQHGQRHPSSEVVVGHHQAGSRGDLTIRMHSAGEKVVRVHWSRIVDRRPHRASLKDIL